MRVYAIKNKNVSNTIEFKRVIGYNKVTVIFLAIFFIGDGQQMDFQQKIQLALTIMITGLVVVFAMLVFLILVIRSYGSVLNALQHKIGMKKRVETPLPPTHIVPPAPVQEEPAFEASADAIPEEIVAVISAAVSCMYPQAKVSAVRRVSTVSKGLAWKAAGLLESTRPF